MVLKDGYILSKRSDAFWFLGLPFIAIAIALTSERWVTAVALASTGLWLTLPHYYATWIRTYALEDEWAYYKTRLVAGPLIIAGLTGLGMYFAPVTLLLVIAMWDHQHSLMQQHGFARIYDVKAKTGAPNTPNLDLALSWFLYVNLFLTTPFFTTYWVRELYRYHLPISFETVQAVQVISYSATGLFLIYYTWETFRSIRSGYPINPVKYLFIGASYFLWYFTAWHTHDLLVYSIAHKIMHGLQYIVIVHWYLWNKSERSGGHLQTNVLGRILHPGSIAMFVVLALMYALVFQLIAGQPLDEFGFGVVHITNAYKEPIKEFGMTAMSEAAGYSLFAGLLIYSTQLFHYYADSFIWKVRDKKVQAAL